MDLALACRILKDKELELLRKLQLIYSGVVWGKDQENQIY